MNEPILALEGALGAFSVALGTQSRSWARALDGQVALEEGLGLIEDLLREADLRLTRLGGIAVGTGPGGFTGLRIALAYAKSLALGAHRPLCGVSSFDILDEMAAAGEQYPRLTVVSGRPGIACIRRTDRDGARVACGAIEAAVARVVEPGETVTIVAGTEDVSSAVGERAKSVLMLPAGSEIPAATLIRIARLRSPAASAHAITPDYGELPAATVKASR